MMTFTPGFTADWTSHNFENWKQWLGHLVGVDGVQMAEIGSYEGRSALWFAENILTGAGARLWCIDTWTDADVYQRFRENTQHDDRIWRFRESSGILRNGSGAPVFDAVYIDGDHSFRWAYRDAINAWPVLKSGGVMIFDDVGRYRTVREATDLFMDRYHGAILAWGESPEGQRWFKKL